jgi:hypothetical protein
MGRIVPGLRRNRLVDFGTGATYRFRDKSGADTENCNQIMQGSRQVQAFEVKKLEFRRVYAFLHSSNVCQPFSLM